MGLKEIMARLGVASAKVGCAVPAQGSYEVVSVDELVKGETKNLVELYARPKRRDDYDETSAIVAWNYTAWHAKGEHHAIGYDSLPKLITGIREELVAKDGPFSGVLVHAYKLTREQREQVAQGLGIRKVAYLETPPPAREPSPGGVRQLERGGRGLILSV